MRKAVAAALNEDPRVWLYAVDGEGESERASVVVSHDYLLNAIGDAFRRGLWPAPPGDLEAWLRDRMPAMVAELLGRRGGVRGFATLAGHRRPVWRLPRARLRPAPGKKKLREAVVFEAE